MPAVEMMDVPVKADMRLAMEGSESFFRRMGRISLPEFVVGLSLPLYRDI